MGTIVDYSNEKTMLMSKIIKMMKVMVTFVGYYNKKTIRPLRLGR
jgi:hypothetical protein